MKTLIYFIKGMVIGLANIIPGISGATMMVAMGIYEKLLQAVTQLLSKPRKSARILVPVGLGAVAAIVFLSGIFTWLLTNWPIPTNFAFIGLIIGSLPLITRQMRFKKKDKNRWISFWALFLIVILGAIFSSFTTEDTGALTIHLGEMVILFLVGMVAAATMVVPGVSGSMVLMILGYYYPVLNAISSSVSALKAFDLGVLFEQLVVLACFGLGVLTGIVVVAKIISWLFKKYRQLTLFAILGLIMASPLAILIQTNWSTISFLSILLSVLSFSAAFALAAWLARRS